MAPQTPRHHRNLVIYEIFVRNHGPHGTLRDVEDDLPRIHALGVDVIWLMPIHPIGQQHRKGSLGSPYSIRDYYGVNPEYGTQDDFRGLVEHAHALGLRVMLDMVFNHTAFDSDLVRDHLDWYHRGMDGGPYRAIQGWTDIVGFKHPNADLENYLIGVLRYWAGLGVDGFRCDVASLLPKSFWREARQQLDGLRPGLLWLAESVNAGFIAHERAGGRSALSDCELYGVFDITYDYDVWPIWQAAVTGRVPVSRYLEMLRFQDCIYPANYVKLRYVEHHDSARILGFAPTRAQALAWTAFQGFNKGAWLLYAGLESGGDHTPSLFDIDPIVWNQYGLESFLRSLALLKKDSAQVEGQFVVAAAEPAIQAAWQYRDGSLYGVFNVSAASGAVDVQLPDGTYEDLLGHTPVQVRAGKMCLPGSAAILRFHQDSELRPFFSDLIDFPKPAAG